MLCPIILRLVFALILMLVQTEKSFSAKIWQDEQWIFVVGEIENGDFRKFSEVFYGSLGLQSEQREPAVGAALYSSGGAVVEATKIGKAIRKLRLRTTGPIPYQGDNNVLVCPPGLDELEETTIHNLSEGTGSTACTCASACALIWSAGILRNGNAGFHRPRFPAVTIENFDTFEANSQKATKLVKRYMRRMDIPDSIILQFDRISDNRLIWVSEFDRLNFIPVFRTLVKTECAQFGDLDLMENELLKLRQLSSMTPLQNHRLSTITLIQKQIASCYIELQEQLAARAREKFKSHLLIKLNLENPKNSQSRNAQVLELERYFDDAD